MVSVRVRGRFLLIAGGCLLLSLMLAWAAPNLLRRRMAACEQSTPQHLRQIDEAVKAYIVEHGTAPPTLSSLGRRISAEWGCEAFGCDYLGYRFQYTVSLRDAGAPRYYLSARPLKQGITGSRSYYLDQSGVLRCTNEARAATGDDQPLPE